MDWCISWKEYEEIKGKSCTKHDLKDDLYYGRITKYEHDILFLQAPKLARIFKNPKGKQLNPLSKERRREIRTEEKRQEKRLRKDELLRGVKKCLRKGIIRS